MIGNTLVTAAAENIDLTENAGVERLRQVLHDELESACAAELHRLSRADRTKLANQIGAPSTAHIKCAIAALVGAVCALPGKLVGDLARAIGERVAKETGSLLAGKLASALVTRSLTNVVLQATPLTLVDQVGFLADLAAVDACPSQHNKSGKRHQEVEECEDRIEKRSVGKLMEAA